MLSPTVFLRAQDLEPLTWDKALTHIETLLSAEDTATFARLHRAFVAYPAEHTCRTFYDFAARHNLLKLLASHRFERLAAILESLQHNAVAASGKRALDFGAGSGVISTWLREVADYRVSALDLSTASMINLQALGFASPVPGERFDLIVCADSLGEIHADEDDWLSEPENSEETQFAEELEARYGLVHKLSSFKGLLQSGGTVLIYEPVPLAHFWSGVAQLLETSGWQAEILGPNPTRGLKLTLP